MRETLVILDDYQGVALDLADWSRVRERYDIEVVRENLGADALIARVDGASILVAMRERTPFPRAVLERLPALRLLVTTGAANASIDLAAARDLGISVAGTGGLATPVPELTFGLMVALGRHLVAENSSMHEGGWQHTLGRGLAGSTLGVVGLGRLGSRVATLAAAFEMRVIAWSPRLTPERAEAVGATAVGQRELFEGSDFVTLHVPLNDGTRGLVGGRELGWMRRSSFLINTSRGPVVDEAALVTALGGGTIAGAAIDTFDQEPLPVEHPLRSLPTALLTPHLGYVTRQTYEIFYGDAVADVLAFDAGEPLRLLT